MIILFPLDYSGTGVDRAFTDEYNAAIGNDISVVFFDQKLWDKIGRASCRERV